MGLIVVTSNHYITVMVGINDIPTFQHFDTEIQNYS